MLRNFFLLFPLYSCRFLDILFSILSSKSENGRTMQNRHYKIVLDRVILLTIFDAIKAEASLALQSDRTVVVYSVSSKEDGWAG